MRAEQGRRVPCRARPVARDPGRRHGRRGACALHQRPQGAVRGRLPDHCRAHPGGRGAPPRFRTAHRRQPQRGTAPQARCRGHLRIHRVPRRHRGGVHPGDRARVGQALEARLLRWLQPGTHQPRRPRAHAHQRDQGGVRRHARDAGTRGRPVRAHRQAGRAPHQQHQGRRGLQGDREHPARPEHRTDERAGDHLRQGRHRHQRSAHRRRHEVELPEVQAPAWSVATASAWTRTT
jgi:hypothetical protein